MSEDDQYESLLIEQELKMMSRPQKASQKWADLKSAPSIWQEGPSSHSAGQSFADPNRHRFNHYADKQLYHLVVTQQFDFGKIANMLNYIFREERAKFTEVACRQRWQELHILRNDEQQVRLKRMEDKRANSVSVFSDPFSLYNLQEMLDKLQKTEQEKKVEDSQSFGKVEGSGYNIFKNSIRQIDDIEGYKKRQKEMLNALNMAQDPTHTINDKLMHFSPYYDRLNEFQVKQQELTEQKMREIMSVPIEIQSLEMELRVKDMNQSGQNWKQKRSKREQQKMTKEEHRYQIQQDWDEYESD